MGHKITKKYWTNQEAKSLFLCQDLQFTPPKRGVFSKWSDLSKGPSWESVRWNTSELVGIVSCCYSWVPVSVLCWSSPLWYLNQLVFNLLSTNSCHEQLLKLHHNKATPINSLNSSSYLHSSQSQKKYWETHRSLQTWTHGLWFNKQYSTNHLYCVLVFMIQNNLYAALQNKIYELW